ncbi:predicted protein [Phaeodactylum tricornutum CCAP 1055/1]|uniref:Uncharacterized protein n=2 Tax=Phaeodactylum tricornutum TaxID=2850 RepID=B7FUD2_PHATC|nr:predicted protein [Phaeodactylum tricornutum CCAP 1055/1]EEC50239.1 predicted protein [Phaeodactylum tricornutum CCAP 1055/1]|eukprot:XP_002178574.1 predicted protein [Phaeodactylum tricornutum CCAP 1055/1]
MNPPDVINWEEAMQQCGDDEEFLRELLEDLRSETDTQLANIAGIIQLRAASMQLEQSAAQAHEAGETVASPDRQHAVQAGYAALSRQHTTMVFFLNQLMWAKKTIFCYG